MMIKMNGAVVVIGLLVASVSCVPKFDIAGFKPSAVDYVDKSGKSQDQMAVATKSRSDGGQQHGKNANESVDRTQEPRFGFTNVADNSGYGVGSYAPGRIDLGGLLLGAVIGIGTILVIPKLLYVLSGSYGAYARSEESGVTQLMSRVDDALASHGVDSTSCMQRLACWYSRPTAESESGKGAGVGQLMGALVANQLVHAALRGSAVDEAIAAGRRGDDCAATYRHCGLSPEALVPLLARLAASANVTST